MYELPSIFPFVVALHTQLHFQILSIGFIEKTTSIVVTQSITEEVQFDNIWSNLFRN